MHEGVIMKKISSVLLMVLIVISLVACNGDESLKLYDIDAYAYFNEGNDAFVRQMAGEGMVLLHNENNALPLQSSDEVVLLGSGVTSGYIAGGGGSGWVNAYHIINPFFGMVTKENTGKIKLNSLIKNAHLSGNPVTNQMITAASETANTAVIFITRSAQETSDRSQDAGDYYLHPNEDSMIELARTLYDKVVVVLNIAGAMDTAWIKRPRTAADALLVAWLPGQEGGDAIADILVGDVNPSGKLAQTFANTYEFFPTSGNFAGNSPQYMEDIFVGYRHFETFDPNYMKVHYEFGYGLSYTTFDMTHLSTEVIDNQLVSRVRVKNTGNVAGKEVAQIYYSAPQGNLGNPAKELAGFAKTKLLRPNEEQILTISFDIDDMAAYDDTGKVQMSAWVLEAGDYHLYVGNSVRNAKERNIAYTYSVHQLIVVEQLTQQLAPRQLTQRLLADGTYEPMNVLGKNIPVSGSQTTVIEAENYNMGSSGLSLQKYANATGIGTAVAFLSSPTAFLQYDLNVAEAGTYQLQFRMANGGAAASDVWTVLVNGSNQNVTVNVPKTGEGGQGQWHNYTLTNTVTVNLSQGQNTLRFESKGGRATNTDSFLLAKNGVTLTSPYQPFTPNTNLGAVLPWTIEFNDVFKDKSLINDFVKQLTIEELIELSKNDEQKQSTVLVDTTGRIGGSLEHLGIIQAETSDGPAGIRAEPKGTYFPSSTLLASTWNLDLAEEFGIRIGLEAKSKSIDIWLAPGMNIQRNPLAGRNFEYYSEDPLVTGLFAKYVTRGVQATGVFVTLKHFIANEKEGNRHNSDSRVSERALREIYLKPFEMVIKTENIQFMMTAYNLVNGEKTAESYSLNTEILRNEWGFTGVTMSDWWNYNAYHFNELNSGANIKSWGPFNPDEYVQLIDQYKDGLISRAALEANAMIVLLAIMETRAVAEIQTVFNFGYNVLNITKFYEQSDTETIYFIHAQSAGTYQIKTNPNTAIYMDNQLIGTTNSDGMLQIQLDSRRIQLNIQSDIILQLVITPVQIP